MKTNFYYSFGKFFLLLLLGTLFSTTLSAQDVIYSETFTNGTSYCPSTPQYDNWGIFRSKLDTTTKKFRKVTVKGSNNTTGVTCSDPDITRKIAHALRTNSTLSIVCDGKTWLVTTGSNCVGGCGTSNDATELVVDFNFPCQCATTGFIFRPCIGNSNWGGINGATCFAPTQTMEVIFSNPVGNNAAPGGVTAPVTSCGAVNDSLAVTIQNAGLNKIADIPVTCNVTGFLGGVPYSNTFNTTIGVSPDSLDPFTSRAYKFAALNTSAGADLDITVYTSLASDTTRGDDTLRFKYKNVGSPTGNATANNVSRCGTGAVTLNATVPGGHSAYWYNSANKLVGVGTTVSSPIIPGGTQDSFFVASAKTSSLTQLGTSFTGTSNAGTGFEGGIMMDLTAAKNITLESIDVHINATVSRTVTVYIKSGTYKGFETNKAAWQLLGTFTVTPGGAGTPVNINIPEYELSPGTYGLYIYASDGLLWTKASLGTKASDLDLSITGAATLRDAFATILATSDRFDGRINYRQSCVSGVRTKVVVTASPLAVGSDLTKGSLFKGRYDAGTKAQPDVVANPDSITYDIPAPTNFNNSGYGSGSSWYVVNYSMQTVNGAVVPASNYKFDAPAGGKDAKISFFPSSTYTDSTVELTATIRRNDNGCDTVLKRIIYIAPRPVTNFTNTVVCFGDVTEFKNNTTISSGLVDYMWKFGDGSTSTLTDPAKTYTAAGNYSVTLIATSDFGYQDSTTITVTVKEIPTPNFTFTNACEGTALTFADASTLPPGAPTYIWAFGDGSTGAGATTSHMYGLPDIYLAKLTVDVAGCASSISKYVTQAPRSVPDFTFTAAQCDNLNIGFTNATTAPAFGTVGYNWHFGDGSQAAAVSPTHAYNVFNTFDVKLIARTDLGCADSVTKSVTLKESPKPVFTTSGQACTNQALAITNNTNVPSGATNTYKWTFGDGNTSTDASPSHAYGAPGTYTIEVEAFSTNGCDGKSTSTVTVGEKPVADFAANKVCEGEETKFVNGSTISTGTLTYSWNLDDGGPLVTTTNPTKTYTGAKTYNVSLITSSNNGCSDTATQAVIVAAVPAIDIVEASANTGNGAIRFTTTSTGTGYTYAWSFGDGGSSTIQNPTYTYSFPGKWTVRLVIRTADGCMNTLTKSVSVNPLSVSDVANVKGIEVYPNPTTGKVIADFTNYTGDNVVGINVTDILGREVLKGNLPNNSTSEVDLSAFQAGIYYLNVETSSNVLTIKLLLAK